MPINDLKTPQLQPKLWNIIVVFEGAFDFQAPTQAIIKFPEKARCRALFWKTHGLPNHNCALQYQIIPLKIFI